MHFTLANRSQRKHGQGEKNMYEQPKTRCLERWLQIGVWGQTGWTLFQELPHHQENSFFGWAANRYIILRSLDTISRYFYTSCIPTVQLYDEKPGDVPKSRPANSQIERMRHEREKERQQRLKQVPLQGSLGHIFPPSDFQESPNMQLLFLQGQSPNISHRHRLASF